jgi:hypothetical protein
METNLMTHRELVDYFKQCAMHAGAAMRASPRFADVSDSDLAQRAATFAEHLANAVDETLDNDEIHGTDCDCKQCQEFWAEYKAADEAKAEQTMRIEAWAAATVEEQEQAAAI